MIQHDYEKINGELSGLFEDVLVDKLNEISKEFRGYVKNWAVETRNEILRIRKEDEEYHKKKVAVLSKNIPDLKKALLETEEFNWYREWVSAVETSVSALSESVTEIQSDDRLYPLEEDSFKIKSGKQGKRIVKSLRSGINFSAENFSFKQEIRLRGFVSAFLILREDWLQDIIASEFNDVTEAVGTLLLNDSTTEEDSDSDSENENEKNEVQEFDLTFLNDLENRIHELIAKIDPSEDLSDQKVKEWIEPLYKDCLNEACRIDTFEQTFSFRKSSKLKEEKDEIDVSLGVINKEWGSFLSTQLSDLKVQEEIALYSLRAKNVQNEILETVHLFFRNAFYLPIELAISDLKTANEKIKEIGTSSKSVKNLKEAYNKVSLEIDEKLLDPLSDTTTHLSVLDEIRRSLSGLQFDANRFSFELVMAKSRERNMPIPTIKFDTIRWQNLATRYLKQMAINRIDPGRQELEQFLNQKANEIRESVHIVDVNLTAAIDSDEENAEETPNEVASEGINRAIATLERIIKDVRAKQNVYEKLVSEELPVALNHLADKMLRREYSEIEMSDTALQMKEQTEDWKNRMTVFLAESSERIELGWRFLAKKYRTNSAPVYNFLGFKSEESVSTREKRYLTEYLVKPGKDLDLPFIYKRLFNRDYEIDERFYISPTQSMGVMRDALDQWKRNIETNVLIFGEKGSGKTTMIQFFENDLFNDEKVYKLDFVYTFHREELLIEKLAETFGFKNITDRQELVEEIGKMKKRPVLIVENLQNIFIRNIHGFGALESFWKIMSSTKDSVFWCVSCSRYSWNYISKITEADQYFSHSIAADILDEEQVKKAIIARHRATGYELYFESNEMIKRTRSFRKLLGSEEKSQEYLRNLFFSKLHKVCEGNISIAMIFWLQSIKEYDDTRFVIKPLEVADVDKLDVPSREMLFTLTALVVHDKLNDEEMAMALHIDPSDSRLMLMRLKSKGIIYQATNGYNLNHLVYRQVVRLLKRRNIIH